MIENSFENESLVEHPALGYYSGINELPKGNKKISPSALSGFFNDSGEWYRRNIEKTEVFEGNTSTVLGSIVHYLAECYEKGVEYKQQNIDDYLDSHVDNENVDIEQIKLEYMEMYESLKAEYLADSRTQSAIETEKFLHYSLAPGFSVGGSIDRLERRTVVDYKTVNKKPSGMKQYRLQLLVYAWLYNKIGVTVDTIKVVAVQRRTKTLPPRTWIIEEIITEADMMKIENMMMTLAQCIKIVSDNFMYKDIIFRDNPMSMFAKDNSIVKRAGEQWL